MNKLKTTMELQISTIIMIVFICFIFGANTVAIKISLEGLGVFTSTALRFFFASIALFLWAIVKKLDLRINKQDFKRIAIITLIFTVQLAAYSFGLDNSKVSRASILINLQPFFVLIMSHFFIAGDQINYKKVIGMTTGFSGVFLLMLNKNLTFDFQIGDILVLSTAFLWAIDAVYLKTFIKDTSVFNITFYQILFSVPFFILGSLFFDHPMIKTINYKIVWSMLYQSLICTAYGFIAWNLLLKKCKASILHSFIFISPASGVFLGVLLLKEPFTINIFGALILISIGVVIAQYPHKTILAKPNTL